MLERPQPDPVFLEERLFAHWHDNLLLPLLRVATVWVLEWRRRVRPEPGALLRYYSAVTLEEDKPSASSCPRRVVYVVFRVVDTSLLIDVRK